MCECERFKKKYMIYVLRMCVCVCACVCVCTLCIVGVLVVKRSRSVQWFVQNGRDELSSISLSGAEHQHAVSH